MLLVFYLKSHHRNPRPPRFSPVLYSHMVLEVSNVSAPALCVECPIQRQGHPAITPRASVLGAESLPALSPSTSVATNTAVIESSGPDLAHLTGSHTWLQTPEGGHSVLEVWNTLLSLSLTEPHPSPEGHFFDNLFLYSC